MKIFVFFWALLALHPFFSSGQIAINNTGVIADSSAILDISSTTKGLLIPRNTNSGLMGILNPAKGLLIMDTTANHFKYFNGNSWGEISSGHENSWAKIFNTTSVANGVNIGIGQTLPAQPLTFPENYGDKISLWYDGPDHYGFGVQPGLFQMYTDASASDIVFGYSGYTFVENLRIRGNGAVGMGIGGTDASALVHVNSENRGVLFPRMTMAQRNAIPSPANGLLIYQTDNKPGIYYNKSVTGSNWIAATESFGDLSMAIGPANVSPIGGSVATTFVGVTDTVEITSSTQKIFVTSQQVLGTTTGGTEIYVWYGYAPLGGNVVSLGAGIFNLNCPTGQRQVYTISGVITGLAPGIYRVGMTGDSSAPATWNNNEKGYTTTIVF